MTREREAEIQKIVEAAQKIVEALEWIMPKVHQGHHDGTIDECSKSTCVEYRKALADWKKVNE